MRFVQHHVELRRLSVLGKTDSLFKIVTMLCVLPMRLSPARVGPGVTV